MARKKHDQRNKPPRKKSDQRNMPGNTVNQHRALSSANTDHGTARTRNSETHSEKCITEVLHSQSGVNETSERQVDGTIGLRLSGNICEDENMAAGSHFIEATSLTNQGPLSGSCDNSRMNVKFPVDCNLMKVKAEPDMEPRTCRTTSASIREPSAPVQHVKVKQEPSSNKTNSALASCGSGAAMDLGSHLQQSLNAPPSSGLTWSQLMEPKNLPKVHETAPICVKKEKSQPTKVSAPMSMHTTPTDTAIYPENQHNDKTSPSTGGYNPGEVNMITLGSSFSKTSRRSPQGATTLLSSFPNRFSSNSENSGKMRAGNGTSFGAHGVNILDLSKRSLPPEIRRVLASKYGVERKNEENNQLVMVPNINKSRSRFTVATRKVGVPEGEEGDRKEDIESPPPSMVLIRSQNTYKDQSDTLSTTSELSMGSSQTIEPNQTVPKIKLSEEFAGSELRTMTSVLKNRESSGSPFSQYLTLDHQTTKDASEQLKNQGLLDLGSHYGELLRDTSPNITSRSSSRSPRADELASRGSPAAQNPMIELGSMQGQWSEQRALRKPGETMIELSSMEKPGASHSPSFKVVSLPGKNYRPNFLPGQNYKPSVSIGRPLRRNSSPGLGHPRPSLGPRSNCSASPQYQTLNGGMIDLGSFGKGSDFRDLVSHGASDVMSRPPYVPSGGESRVQKRTHSVSSEEEAKRSCTERNNERLEKGQCGVKVNISDLLKLEQEEQKYIQDLSVVQFQLTGVRFKIDKLQQKLNSLQNTETEIKRHIDIVRSSRVGILKDAQDREVSGSTRETNAQGVTKNEDRIHAVDRQSVFSERKVTHDRTSPGFLSGTRSDVSDGYSGETKRMVELVDVVKEGEEDMRRELERLKTRVEGDITDGNQRNPDVVPSEMILVLAHGSCGNSISHYHQHSRKGGGELIRENLGKFEGLDESLDVIHEKIPAYVEKFEILDDDAENEDGTVRRVQQDQPSRWQHVNQGSRSVLVEQPVDSDSGKDGHLPDESKQFLGCLEISSTTEEPMATDDDGCKEILVGKERELLANRISSEQGTISSTVQSVLGFDVVTQAGDTGVDSLSEMEFVGHSNAVGFLLPYKGKLFSASADRTTKAFDLKTGELVTSFQGHDGSVNCLQIASDGSNKDRLFTGSNDQTVRTYNVKSGLCTHKFCFRGRVMCLHIAFGKLFVGLSSGFVAVIDLKTNKDVDQFNCHEPCRISCLSSASEGQRALLCTGSFDSTITIRDQSTGLLLRTITDHKLTVLCMQVVENILFSGSADTIVQSHNINTGQLVRSYSGHSMSVSGLQALGGVLVTSSLDRIIRCFDIKTGDLLQLYGGNNNMIFSLAVFNDMIYTGCKDGRLSGIKLDLRKYHSCKWGDCSLKFGLLSHLKEHVQDHINQTTDIDCCLWGDCFRKFPRMKNQLDINQVAMEHIFSHVSDKET